jgi:hypothetical protein
MDTFAQSKECEIQRERVNNNHDNDHREVDIGAHVHPALLPSPTTTHVQRPTIGRTPHFRIGYLFF